MITELLLILTVIIAGVLLYLFKFARENYGHLENCGTPVIKPTLFLGSQPNGHKLVLHHEDFRRFKKYGPIWSLYDGREPQVFLADADLIRQIFVKDFDYFHNRREMDFGTEYVNEVLDFLPLEKWKTVRSLLTPIFTTSKLKSQAEVVSLCAQEHINDLKSECCVEQDGKMKVDMKLRLSAMLIDMFARSVLGIQVDDAKNPHNKLATSFRKLIGEDIPADFLQTLTKSFPFLITFAPTLDDKSGQYIASTIRSVLNSRRHTTEQKSVDFVDYLNELWSKLDTEEFKRLKITETTIIAQGINFFLGGYDTTTTTLSHLLYYMASNAEMQIRLQEELDNVFEQYGKFDLESTKDENIPYTLAVINESLRLGPSLFRPERVCMNDWHYNGITIKKGTTVFSATWALHRNPEYYENPETFQPERFLPENKDKLNPYAFGTFGHGPRMCIGMRFAYYSLKMFVANIFHNFNVEKRQDTKFNYKKGFALVLSFDPLYFDLSLRKSGQLQ